MKTIAFFNVKGGVGKTTSSITVAHILATVFKKKTLLIDLDPQSNSTDYYNRYDSDYSVGNVMSGKGWKEGKEISITAADAILHTEFENLDIIPSNLTLGRLERSLAADVNSPQQFKLKNALKEIESQYDYVVLDMSPSAESLVNTNGLAIADMVFVPLKCDKWATRGLNATIEVINTVSTYNVNLKFGGCFFVQWENRNINKAVYDALHSELSDKLLPHKIRKNKSVEEMTYNGRPLVEYDNMGTSTLDYLDLTQTIIDLLK